MSLTKVSYSMIEGGCANVLDFGAEGDGVANDTAAIQAAVDSLSVSGGAVYFPSGTYKVVPLTATTGCIWIPHDNITLFGDGSSSVIQTTTNASVPIHVCSTNDLTIVPSAITQSVQNFVCRDLAVNGTSSPQYFALGYGRGILMRVVTNAIVKNCFVTDMSMIGICSEGGNGKFLVDGNLVTNCYYSAINYNGRCYQSIITNNICFGSNISANSVSIQASGHCIIHNNTVYGSPGDYANCGGIMWGESPYTGVGVISGNIVKHCRFGIKALYNGPCTITDNLIVNCLTTGGINLIGDITLPSFPVGSSDNIVSNNTLINNYPAQITCSAPNSVINGNRLIGHLAAINAGGPTEPDTIIDVIPEISIEMSANYCSIIGNIINGVVRGVVQLEGTVLGVFANNDMYGVSAGNMAVQTTSAVIAATTGLINRVSDGTGLYQSQINASSKPTEGFWKTGDIWNRYPLVISSTLGAVVVGLVSTTTTATAATGATAITTAAAPSAAAGNILGIQLDNSSYHWTTTTSVVGATVNFSAPIPTGRSVANGAKVYGQQWRDLAVLA